MIKSLQKSDGRQLNVCAYARISNDKEELEGSLEEQISFYTNLILQNENWNFCGIYADDGISGTSTTYRNQFNQMLDKARAKQIDIILVKSISRFARNIVDLLETVRELRLLGVEVIFEREGLSTLDTKCDQMLTCYAKFAEEEAISMSKNVKWRYERNKEKGIYHLPVNLLGYKTINGEITIVESEAKWIREMFKMYANGHSIGEIEIFLEKNKVKTTTGNLDWHPSTIREILVNEKYVGDCLIQKCTSIGTIGAYRPNRGEEDQVYITNGHPAIIDRETFNKCQQIRSERRDKYMPKIDGSWRENVDMTYSQYAYCPYCKKFYSNKTNHYNGQPARKFLKDGSNKSTAICKKGTSLFQDVLNDIIIKQLYYLKANIPEFRKYLVVGFTNPKENDTEKEIKTIESKIEKLRSRLKTLDGKYDDFSEAIGDEITNQIKELTANKLKLENDLLTAVSAEYRAKQIIDFLKNMPEKITDAHQIDFRKVLVNVIVRSRDDLIFVIGNNDLTAIPLDATTSFNLKHKYTIRKTSFTTEFGIYINY
jgi:DNA invertase Pin-like site-specific DNA recombinase